MEAAISEPVIINRRDGESFILMSKQTYDDFRNEIQLLQRQLLGMSEMIDGKTTTPERKKIVLKDF
jgi:PHD/YefM family antitoxin component YafN of YafNO toxin-antitoxin module